MKHYLQYIDTGHPVRSWVRDDYRDLSYDEQVTLQKTRKRLLDRLNI